MLTMDNLLHSPAFWATAGAAAQYVFSAFVGSMPEPEANATRNYVWLYQFLQKLAANFSFKFGAKKDAANSEEKK